MPSRIQIHVKQAKDLHFNERKTADTYVEVKFATKKRKTKIVHNSLRPEYDDKMVLEIGDDNVMQDNLVEFK
jgi:Ca2+-dependent lipid-binding protein